MFCFWCREACNLYHVIRGSQEVRFFAQDASLYFSGDKHLTSDCDEFENNMMALIRFSFVSLFLNMVGTTWPDDCAENMAHSIRIK
jgi:hypothetical protein